jgi:hypothetical protein
MKRTCLILTVVAAAGVGGCAWNMSQAQAFGISIAQPRSSSLSPAETSTSWSISVSAEVLQQWSFLYLAIDKNEFALCLEGDVTGKQVRIDNFRVARIRASSIDAVDFQRCENANYVGMAHNHPRLEGSLKGPCYFSELDKRSFGKDKRALVDVVICGAADFLWAGKPARHGD